jgi:hypothetical protein
MGFFVAGGFSPTVSAVPMPISGGQIVDGEGCTTTNCSTVVYLLTAPAAGTGSLELDTGLGTLDFSFTVTLSNFDAVGSDDNGVTSIDFENLVYTGSVNVTETSPDLWSLNPNQTGEVSGTFSPNGAGSDGAVAVAQSLLTGSCSVSGLFFCGITFNTVADFNIGVAGQTRPPLLALAEPPGSGAGDGGAGRDAAGGPGRPPTAPARRAEARGQF